MGKTDRDQIIRAARDMLRDHGFDGLSMGDLAARLGIRKASLYGRFASKEEVALAALDLTAGEMRALLRPPSDDWLGDLRDMLTGIGGYLVTARRCIGLHLVYGAAPDGLAQAVRSFFQQVTAMLHDVLVRGLDGQAAAALAADAVCGLEGATLWLVLHGDDGPMRRAVDSLLARAEALALADSPAARVLARYAQADRAGSSAERKLATAVAELEGDLLTLRAALAGQIEAESCFR